MDGVEGTDSCEEKDYLQRLLNEGNMYEADDETP